MGLKIIPGSADWKFNGSIQICIVRSTNYVTNLVIPQEATQAFDYSLRGTNSQFVEKTPEGKKYGAELSTSVRRIIRKRGEISILNEGILRQLCFFDIDDCFIIKEDGDYELEVKPRLLKEIGGDDVTRVFYDAIKVKLHLKANVQAKH